MAHNTEVKPWKPLIMRKSKARLIERVFITNGSQRSGYFPDLAAAEAECAKLNSSKAEARTMHPLTAIAERALVIHHGDAQCA